MTAIEGIREILKVFIWSAFEAIKTIWEIDIIRNAAIIGIPIIILISIVQIVIRRARPKRRKKINFK